MDLAGNVWELTLDWWGTYPVSPSTNDANISSGDARVIRGANFDNWQRATLRAAFRNYFGI
jgi:formylglycine-generating enzyme required for sulfatase activity